MTLRLRANTAPVFADDLVAITLPENSAVGTSVGAAVTATDADDDTLTYSLEGTDAASFDIDSGTGQIETKSGVTYDFEAAQNTYEMTVKADDGNGGTDTIEVNIALLDADEKPDKPAKPELAAVSGSTTSLTATWEKPGLNGGPDITGYDVQYKLSTESSWIDFAHTGTGVTATVTGLTADTAYQVRVRAKNGETPSDWSDPSDAVSTNAVVTLPTVGFSTDSIFIVEERGEIEFDVVLSAASTVADRGGLGDPRRQRGGGRGLHGGVGDADVRAGRHGGDRRTVDHHRRRDSRRSGSIHGASERDRRRPRHARHVLEHGPDHRPGRGGDNVCRGNRRGARTRGR